MENIDALKLRKMIEDKEDFQLVDVRTPFEFEDGGIRGAKLIPLNELEARMDELDKDKKLVLYCRSGNRSAFAGQILEMEGFDVMNLSGGILAWNS
jgi:rhodanese-related sulfurtransferase